MMKLVLILVCAVVFFSINSVESSYGGFCHRRPNGNYRNPADCHSYIACSNGYEYLMQCHPGYLKWNNRKKQCDWPRNVRCRRPPGRCYDRLSRSSCRFLARHSQCRKLIVRKYFCTKTCKRC